ncbi:hypothetical protein L9F63_015630, partial [Diploptera punctata]
IAFQQWIESTNFLLNLHYQDSPGTLFYVINIFELNFEMLINGMSEDKLLLPRTSSSSNIALSLTCTAFYCSENCFFG